MAASSLEEAASSRKASLEVAARRRARARGLGATRALGQGVVGLVLVLGALGGCSVGVGEGELTGVITDPECDLEAAPVDVRPNFFVADDDREAVVIRVQRGGDFLVFSDGLSVAVSDAAREVERLGTPVPVGPDADVRMTFHYNHTCGFDRDRLATVLTAVEGTITFESLWAPEVDGDQLESAATFEDVRFVDPARPDERFAVLSGSFRFLFNRGRPAQRYP